MARGKADATAEGTEGATTAKRKRKAKRVTVFDTAAKVDLLLDAHDDAQALEVLHIVGTQRQRRMPSGPFTGQDREATQ